MTLGKFKDRKSNRLIPSGSKSWLAGLFVILLVAGIVYQRSDSLKISAVPVAVAEVASGFSPAKSGAEARALEASTEPSSEGISRNQKDLIESLFRNVSENPVEKEKNLRELRRVLQTIFKGQEDCWSCEGVIYFDRFDEMAGRGEGRKPMSLKDWISEGDEAYESRDLDNARQFYGEAMAVLDERVFQPEDEMDGDAITRLQTRCRELDCR